MVHISQRSNAEFQPRFYPPYPSSPCSMNYSHWPSVFRKKKEGLVDTIPSPGVYEIKWHAKAFHRWLDVGVKSLKLALRSPVCDASRRVASTSSTLKHLSCSLFFFTGTAACLTLRRFSVTLLQPSAPGFISPLESESLMFPSNYSPQRVDRRGARFEIPEDRRDRLTIDDAY